MGEIKKSPDPMKANGVKGFLKNVNVSVCVTQKERQKKMNARGFWGQARK